MSQLNLSKKSIFLLILPALIIGLFGLVIDIISVIRLSITGRGFITASAIFLPFTVSTIIFAFLLVGIIHLTNLRNKAAIIGLSMFIMLLNMITVVYLGDVVGGIAGEFYCLVYLAGFIPALIVGFIYGKIITSKIVI